MGRLRGKRNRDRERDLTILRRAEQSGMVGTDGLLGCVFCSCLLTSYDAHFSNGGDAFCQSCGDERGLIQIVRVDSSASLEALNAIDAISFGDTGCFSGFKSGLVGVHSERLTGRREDRRRASELREIEHQIAIEQRRVERFSSSFQLSIEREIKRQIAISDEIKSSIYRAMVSELPYLREAERQKDMRAKEHRRSMARRQRAIQHEIERAATRERQEFARVFVFVRDEVVARAKHLKRDQTSMYRALYSERHAVRRREQMERRIQRRIRAEGCSVFYASRRRQIIYEERAAQFRVEQEQFAKIETYQIRRKITDAEVIEMRKRYATGTASQQRLADEFGCTPGHVGLVVTGSVYHRVGGPLHLSRADRELLWSNGGVVWPWASDHLARAGLVLHPEDGGFRCDLGSPAFDEFRTVDAVDGTETQQRQRHELDEGGSPEVVGRGSEEEVRSSVGEDRAADGESGDGTESSSACPETADVRQTDTGSSRGREPRSGSGWYARIRDVRTQRKGQTPFKALGAATPATFDAISRCDSTRTA